MYLTFQILMNVLKAHLDVIKVVRTPKEVSSVRAGLATNWTEMARNAMVSYIIILLIAEII
jgi:hypothetical protein